MKTTIYNSDVFLFRHSLTPVFTDHTHTLNACPAASDKIKKRMNEYKKQGEGYHPFPGKEPNCSECVADVLGKGGLNVKGGTPKKLNKI